jgi:hypothetical protein
VPSGPKVRVSEPVIVGGWSNLLANSSLSLSFKSPDLVIRSTKVIAGFSLASHWNALPATLERSNPAAAAFAAGETSLRTSGFKAAISAAEITLFGSRLIQFAALPKKLSPLIASIARMKAAAPSFPSFGICWLSFCTSVASAALMGTISPVSAIILTGKSRQVPSANIWRKEALPVSGSKFTVPTLGGFFPGAPPV